MNPFLPALLSLVIPAAAQGLPDRFKENRVAWEESLDQGAGDTVRKATDDLLRQEGSAVNPSDYNAMHAMVAVMNLAARACVVEGTWEDAILYLERASQTAQDNATMAESTFAKLITQHQDKLKEWREACAQQEKVLQGMEQGSLTLEQKRLKGQIQNFLDEHRKAIAQSEKSLKEIDALLALLRKEKDTYAASLNEWQGFLAKERADITRLGSVSAYVADKFEQVKADDARPRTERLAYGRRLLRLNPNPQIQRFVDGLEGKDDEASAPQRKTKRVKVIQPADPDAAQ